ncbi:hypothetical protein Taro_005732 [Colocasia esculenta]|uniref:Epidermal patterning factor-like protein n=1 Tax=Colocasia esculenta TaxID=4460 RepID=A0A843TQN6_COLES|nr:hypothetical protein [Colocasia esculenta]
MTNFLSVSSLLLTLLNLLSPATSVGKLPISTQQLSPASSVERYPVSAPQGMIMEDKIRLGSTPPSCHNRCNECNPCTAVQVPTLPGHDQVQPGPNTRAAAPMDDDDSYKKYPNYKPLGWKCRCGDRVFNP